MQETAFFLHSLEPGFVEQQDVVIYAQHLVVLEINPSNTM